MRLYQLKRWLSRLSLAESCELHISFVVHKFRWKLADHTGHRRIGINYGRCWSSKDANDGVLSIVSVLCFA